MSLHASSAPNPNPNPTGNPPHTCGGVGLGVAVALGRGRGEQSPARLVPGHRAGARQLDEQPQAREEGGRVGGPRARRERLKERSVQGGAVESSPFC